MYSLGIDLGTSAVKLLLIDSSGKTAASASEKYPLFMPRQGWSEQNPEDWWKAVCKALLTLGNQIDLKEIHAISFAGQMHGLVALDSDNRLIRPAILWNDTRTEEETRFLNDDVGRDFLLKETGNIAYAGFTAPKLLWMKKHEADLFARIRHILLPKDYLCWRFTGKYASDYSDASGTLLLRVKERQWSQKCIELCGLRRDMLPTLYESDEIVAPVLPELAKELGLSPDCLVAAGAGDNAAAAIGTGTIGDKTCNISLGTSGTIFLSSKEFVPMPESELHSFAHADHHFHVMGCILSAASANQWWIEDILQDKDYEIHGLTLPETLEARPFFVPYLMGERSPHNDSRVRGAFFGLSRNTTREEMKLAVLEGVAFALRECYEAARALGLEVERATVTGGGAKSTLWKQILANVLNLTIDELETEEGPALGAAILAGTASGDLPSLEEGIRLYVRRRSSIYPEKKVAAAYDRMFRQYQKLYPLVREFGLVSEPSEPIE